MLAPLGTGAAALRAELDQNKVVSGETSINHAVAAKFCRARGMDSRPGISVVFPNPHFLSSFSLTQSPGAR